MIPTPICTFFTAAGEVVGKSAEAGIVDQLRRAVHQALTGKPFTCLDLAAVKTGRLLFAVAYIRPEDPSTVQDLDEIRQTVQLSCERISPAVKTEAIYTGIKPFD